MEEALEERRIGGESRTSRKPFAPYFHSYFVFDARAVFCFERKRGQWRAGEGFPEVEDGPPVSRQVPRILLRVPFFSLLLPRYVLYKLPKVSETSNPLIRSGRAYLYITNKTVNAGWRLSRKDIGSRSSTPGNTLSPLYDDATARKKLWILYNDSPPNGPSNGKYGHTKGAVMADKDQGFWLVHSVPNFPPAPRTGERLRKISTEGNSSREGSVPEGSYDYPSTGNNYGQSFLCVSLGRAQFDSVGRQLMFNQIIVYGRNLPDAVTDYYPVLRDAANQARIREPPYNNKATIRSLGAREFVSFAKSDKWQKDLYDEFVAPQLQSDLLAETWLNGRGRLPSDCAGAKVYNVESVLLSAANVDFASSRDHSKWAVTMENRSNKTWTCVGDINRSDTQYSRGGGTLCFGNADVWRNYRNAVNDVEPCPKRN